MSLHSTYVLSTLVGRPHDLESALQQALIGWEHGLVVTMATFIGHLQEKEVVAAFKASNDDVERALRRLHAASLIRLGQYVQQSGRRRRPPTHSPAAA